MAPPSNVEATAFILDINPLVGDIENGRSFFEEAVNCVTRVIERKLFSRPNDLVSLILMGSEETNNSMYQEGASAYQNISVATEFATPTWDLINLLKNKLKLSSSSGDWIDALIVAADFLTSSLEATKVKVSCKKIVLMCDFKTKTTIELDQLQQILNGFNNNGIELIFIGSSILGDDEEESQNVKHDLSGEQEYNLNILSNIVEELDSIKCTFDEANLQLKFHKKKTVNLRPWNVDLSIGSDIKIPISGYGRIRDEPPVKIPWSKVVSKSLPEGSMDTNKPNLIAVETIRCYSKADDNMDVVNKADVIDGYTYGNKTIPFTELEESMSYQSGERGLICYGFTKIENINCSHLSDNGVTYLFGRKDNANATAAIEALATALKQNGLVLVARKVYNKNNAPRMVALFPIIKKAFKSLSMISLAYREDHRHMLLPGLNQKKFAPDDEQMSAMSDLISSMDLSRRGDDGKEIYSIEASINPTLQYTYDSLAFRALNPGKPLPGPRPEVQKLLEVPSSIAKISSECLQNVKTLFPTVAIEKTSGKEAWLNKHFAGVDKKESLDELVDNVGVTASSVLVKEVVKISTVNPTQDFKELSKTDFSRACSELMDVIENLVIYTFNEDYSKPLSALKEMRLCCVGNKPSVYNDWLLKFKDVLLERFKVNFLKQLIENKLSLITNEESSSSSITPSYAKSFEEFTVAESISKPTELDDMSDLFD